MQQDPYCILSLNSAPGTPFFTTSIKDQTVCPIWNESSWVYVPRIPAQPTLHIKIFDHDKFGKHDILGQVDIPLNSLRSGKHYDRWCKIEGQTSSAGMLSVAVRRAKGLPAMDRNGKSDPYCVLRLLNEHGEAYSRGTKDLLNKHADGGGSAGLPWQSQGIHTRVVPSELNPIWEESFLLDVPSPVAILEIQCFDHDTFGRHDLLGTVRIPVSSLTPRETLEQWLTLEVPEDLMPRNTLLIKGGKVEGGTVLIETFFSPASPDSCTDGSIRLCLQMLDKEQLGVPVDQPSALERAFAQRAGGNSDSMSEFNQVEDAIRKRLEHNVDSPFQGESQSEEKLLHNESYLAWAERGANNFANLKSFSNPTIDPVYNRDQTKSLVGKSQIEAKSGKDIPVSSTCCVS